MNKQILAALNECREKIEHGANKNQWTLVGSGLFGLKILEIMLSEPKPELNLKPKVHVIQMDGGKEEPDLIKKVLFAMAGIGIPPHCPQCGNEEINPGAKFCKICGLPLGKAQASKA
ncbi:MAG: zinc ribbon domain-containing protein [Syntrophomonadaceae bacterium]|nr:zinc ribbon domain-containing protein [Syntrophomonadaceae bacterium]